MFEIIFTACLHELLIIADHSDGCTSKLFSDLTEICCNDTQNTRFSNLFSSSVVRLLWLSIESGPATT